MFFLCSARLKSSPIFEIYLAVRCAYELSSVALYNIIIRSFTNKNFLFAPRLIYSLLVSHNRTYIYLCALHAYAYHESEPEAQ
jgi:hypothetical protein